jgi:hypothetical protein
MQRLLGVFAIVLVACASGSASRRVTLPAGGHAASIARWAISDATALPGGRIAVAAHYQGSSGDSHRWMPRDTGDIVAAIDGNGAIGWILAAPGGGEHAHHVTTTADDSVWILAKTLGPFVDPRVRKLAVTSNAVTLTRATAEGRVETAIELSSLGITEDVYPVYLAPASDSGVVAVLGGKTTIIVARVASDGTARFVRRLDRGAEMPLAPTIRVVATSHGDRIWLAGAGTSLHVVTGQELAVEAKAKSPTDGIYHGPMVLELAMDSGDARVFPLEPIFISGGWKYPNAIAFVGGRVVLGRKTASGGSMITVHDPATLAETHEIFRAEHVGVTQIAADGNEHVVVAAEQDDHAAIRYGNRTVSTSTAPPTTSAAVAFRLSVFAPGAPTLVTAALARSADTDVGGSVSGGHLVVRDGRMALAGTFSGVLRVDDAATLHGTYGTEDRCTHEDYVHRKDCDSIFWEVASAFVVLRPIAH